jgi:hypothetical protein
VESAKFVEMWKEIRLVFDWIIRKYDFKWIYRERKINTRFLVLFILRLVIPKDERGYGITLIEIFHNFFNFGIENMPKSLAASSICEARSKLDPIIFKEINTAIIDIWNQYNEQPLLWHGHRLYGVDGSKLNVPRELLKSGYETPGDHAHYPQGLLSAQYDLLTGIPIDFDFVSHGNERTCALEHIKLTNENSVTVYDRGYFSFELLFGHKKENSHTIFRLQSKTNYKELDDFWATCETDKIVVLQPPKYLVKEVKCGVCNIKLDPITVRLIKYKINGNIYVLLTTLTDKEKYPESIFPDAYHSRWGQEEMYKVSKEITGVKDFHSKSESGIKQELYAHFILITLLKIIQSQAHHELEEKKANSPKKRTRFSKEKKSTLDGGVKPDQTSGSVEKTNFSQEMPSQDVLKMEENAATSNREEPLGIEEIAILPPENGSTVTNDTSPHTEKWGENGDTPLTGQTVDQSENESIKVNQKVCFLLVGWTLEKLLYFCASKIEEGINMMVDSAQKLYQKIRPNRSYPRNSKSPPSKWVHKRKA